MMSKAKTKPAASPETVTITYDLFELPTAQHKAGLAGLLLQIRHMEGKTPRPPNIPKIIDVTATSATIEFDERSAQALLDDCYSAEWVEAKVKSKWSGAELLREEVTEDEVEGKKKTVRLFVYRVVQPTGAVLRRYLPETDPQKGWHKLWCDMLWAIPRGNPQSRQPFEQRADGTPCKEGTAIWADLLKAEKARGKNGFHIAPVAGSLWLGAQAVNAENIPFEGRVEQTLLLHFWPITALVFVPQAVQQDGTSEFVGYVLAIPEVSDLPGFVFDYPRMLADLGKDARGYRPAEAVIDVPAEGALSFLEHLAALSADKATQKQIKYSLGSVEFMHLAKVGNNIKILASGRVVPRPGLLEDYLGIVGRPGEKPPYGNPLFRRGLMLALLNNEPWHRPFGKLFAEWPHTFFVRTDAPPKFSWFWIDAKKKLQEELQAMPTDSYPGDSPPDADNMLMTLIHRLTRTYLAERAKQKSGIEPEKFKDGDKIAWDKLPKDYYEARRTVGESLFLEFRSRRDQAFVDHFAQTFFAAKQYVSEDQYAEIGRALLNRTADVKTLTLMSLSANS